MNTYHSSRSDPDVRRIALWSLREDVLVETEPSGHSSSLLTRWGEVRIDEPGPMILELLRRMSFGPVSLDNVLEIEPMAEPGMPSQRQRLAELLESLQYMVIRSLGREDGNSPLLSVVPITRDATFTLRPIPNDRQVRLSFMATLRTQDDTLLLESPLAAHRVVLNPLAAAMTAALGGPASVNELATLLNLPVSLVSDVVGYLVATGMVVVGAPAPPDAGTSARFAEDIDPTLMLWAHHELLFHPRSRADRYEGPYGAAVPDAIHAPTAPAVRTPPPGPRLRLFRPALASLLAADPPLTATVEARRSYRQFGTAPVTAEQLGELLYRAARVRSLHNGPGDDKTLSASDRPYPSNAGLHELELYVVVDRCPGVSRAIHHYDPLGHTLTVVNSTEEDVSALLDTARIAGGMVGRPPVLITITARVHRLSWTHQGGAYASTLKHVGVLQQTLYLVATAMGLAPCAVSARDDDDQTVRALDLDWRTEPNVGEFVFGSRPIGDVSVGGQPLDRSDIAVNDADWPQRARVEIERHRSDPPSGPGPK